MSRISFLGDFMCEKPFLKSAYRNGAYDFSGFLTPCCELFGKSDFIVGNLETPCDPASDLTDDMFIFNAPGEFLQTIKSVGINLVTTATNHCLDRGMTGVKNSIEQMDAIGLYHTGTFLHPNDKRYHVIKFSDGTKLAVLSYTYGTNYMDNKVVIPDKEFYAINYLTPLYSGRNKVHDTRSYSLRARLTRVIPRSLRIRINSVLGRSSNVSFTDKIQDEDISDEHLKTIAETIRLAKSEADLVFVCPHFGGQFNTEPGTYVQAFTAFFQDNYIDAMIGNHPHVAQQIERTPNGMIAAYSLGNISMSLSTPYIIMDNLPDYSIMLHFDIDNKKIIKISFSILVEREQNGFITVFPLNKLYEESGEQDKLNLEKNCRIIYNRVLNKQDELVPILEKYPVEV